MMRRGKVFWVEDLPDPNGKNPKDRPFLVISNTDSNERDGRATCVALSHSAALKSPRPESLIPVPFSPDGRACTSLRKETVAICFWTEILEPDQISNKYDTGFVRNVNLEVIVNKVKELRQDS